MFVTYLRYLPRLEGALCNLGRGQVGTRGLRLLPRDLDSKNKSFLPNSF